MTLLHHFGRILPNYEARFPPRPMEQAHRDGIRYWSPHLLFNEADVLFGTKKTETMAEAPMGGSYHIHLKKGDAIPFTYLKAIGGGYAGNDLRLTTPTGKSIPGMQGSTVEACNAGKFT
ncbi:hypothetical protein FVEN_g2126 [Fusarium venenatum]|uniref:Uncharacterized protein n=1 Tax=Fusarium venenatum TaxID=56646 RepID=A0A2L2T770_9HYPO|nr:uncharacterized protein FVRRES_12539 [Fusarium venenatum]KAG8360115.1 hypothetical protein FVEN_g2126 [Fusarium venenatum]CEI39848.1 unnamed protein product [Fusarium venenatum]